MQENSTITQRQLGQIHANSVKQASTMLVTIQSALPVLQIQPRPQAAANVPTASATKASKASMADLARPARQARMIQVIAARLARGAMQENLTTTQRQLGQILANPVKQASTMPVTMQRVSTVLQIQLLHQAAAS